jgi:pentatricopeptide repeat protein
MTSQYILDTQNAQKNVVNMFLEAAEVLLDPPSDHQDFRKTITDRKQVIAQSLVTTDHEVLELAAKIAMRNDRFALVPHILRVGCWLGLDTPATLYENICNSLLISRQWDLLLRVLRFRNDQKLPPTTKLLNLRLRVYLHTEDYSRLQMSVVKRLFSECRCQFDRETFNILIEASVANRDMHACRQNVVQMIRDGFEINEETHRAILVRMVAMGPNQRLEATIFQSLQGMDPSLDTAILNSLIRLRSIARDDAMLRQYISHIRRGRPTAPHAATYWEVPPNISTISTLIEHFGRRRQINAALEVFGLISHLKLKLSTEAVASLIYAYGHCDKIQKALAIAADLSKFLPPARRERAHRLLQDLGWDGSNTGHDISEVTANVFIFNSLLKMVIAERGLDAVEIVLNLMEAHYVAPDDDTAAIYLRFLDRFKNTNSDDIICILYRFAHHRLNWRRRHVNVILHAILREHKKLVFGPGGWKAASVSTLPNRERISVHPMASTFSRARNVFGIMDGAIRPESAFNERLRDILVTVHESGARQDHATYSIQMIYHARITRDAAMVEEIYKVMVENDIVPNAYHTAALMEAYCFTGQVQKAQSTLSKAAADGIIVNRVLYTLLIRAFGNQGDPDSAYHVYKQMIQDNVRPDIAALDAVIRSYFIVKDYFTGRKVLFQLWGTVLPLDTVPPPTTTLSNAMSHLRELEKMNRPSHSKRGPKDAPRLKEITTRWRRTTSRQQLKTVPPALRSLISVNNKFRDGDEDDVHDSSPTDTMARKGASHSIE